MKLLTILLLFLHSIILSAHHHHHHHHPDIVQDTCKKCSSPDANYTLCVDSFDSIPRSHRADLRGLGVIAAKLGARNAKLVRSKVRTMLKSHPKDGAGYLTSCLETCLELYSDSVSGLKDSATAIRGGRYDYANVAISAAVDAPGECEDGFSEGGIDSLLTEENHEFFGHAVIALDVTAMLQGQTR
ncbi:putative invertase inhibitor [Iris pallida]|uniref:Invertase inhibitor n=1 Tax=Iris pallida TaxID=29817 RepID=A0AAX6EAV2_IRIPA|nr:putative invertase inhibitor [Iris pallida]